VPSNFKKMVKARMEETGESWQAAARGVRQQGEKQVRKDLIDFIVRFEPVSTERKVEIRQKLEGMTTLELRALAQERAAVNIALGAGHEEKDWTEEEQEDRRL
jgi:hypothetical protein